MIEVQSRIGDRVGEAPRRAAGGSDHHRLIDIGCAQKPHPIRPSQRVADVALRFGVPQHATSCAVVESTHVLLAPGRVVLLLGPSGAGKSSGLAAIQSQFATACSVQTIAFPSGAAVIDAVAPQSPLGAAVALLTACGLGEPRLWLRPFAALSDGERFRARLARAVGLASHGTPASPLLCDEFCTGLHRRLARAVAFNLHKLATRRGLCVVAACSDDDLVAHLNPHAVVRLSGVGRPRVDEREVGKESVNGLSRRWRVEPGSKRDYDAFAAMHYRDADELGFVDKVFVLRDGPGGDALGIVVYAHAPLELALRNEATGGWFSRSPGRVNRHLRILRRLVIHPDVRGCGLGHFLVRHTLPRLGTRFVECLATMGEFNPVFEKAGMTRIGQYGLDPDRQHALDALAAMDVDPCGPEFETQAARRPDVRAIVARAVRAWYAGTTGGGEGRVAGQSPEFLARTFRGLAGVRPVYYLWQNEVPPNDTEACARRTGDCGRGHTRKAGRASKAHPFERPAEGRLEEKVTKEIASSPPASLLRNPSGARRAARPRRGHAAGS